MQFQWELSSLKPNQKEPERKNQLQLLTTERPESGVYIAFSTFRRDSVLRLSSDSQSRTAPGLSGGTPGNTTCYGFCQLNLITLKVIYKGFFKSFVVLYADRICPEHHFSENRMENFPNV